MARHCKLYAANLIGVLECGDDIIFVVRCRSWCEVGECEVVHDDWDGGQTSQMLPDRRSVRAEECEIETAW